MSRRRVLIVDDNHDAAELMGALMRLGGHEVVVVHDGAAALAAAPPFHPDLVLLDIGLPGISGYDVARGLRADGCCATLAAVTSHGSPEDRQRSRAAGIDHHFVKPVDPSAFDRFLS